MVTETEHPHIVRNDRILSGEPIIKGTRTPVRSIVNTWLMGVTPEESPQRLPHLTLAAVFDVLSYQCDHREEIKSYMELNRIPEELIDPRFR